MTTNTAIKANDAIRSLREELGMTVEEFAQKARLSTATIYNVERRDLTEKPMCATTAERLAIALEIGKTVHDLVQFADEGYGIISDINRDVNKKYREPQVEKHQCINPVCGFSPSITELNRNDGLWCDNCA